MAGAAVIPIPTELRETVIAIAQDAGQAIMQVYAQDFTVERKDDASPVTQADWAAHRVIVDGLGRLTPDVPVLSEESVQVDWSTRRRWDSYWLVDPLDGTREFVKRNGEFSVNIALIHRGVPVLGVVQAPVDGRIWYATCGQNAYRRDGHRDRLLHTQVPAGAPLRVVASRSHPDARTVAALERMGLVDITMQGASLKFCRIAEGDQDVYLRLGPTSEWDTAAGQCVLHAAGGVLVATASGKPFRYNRRESLLNGEFIALGDLDLPWRDWVA